MNNHITRIGRFEIWGEWTPELVPVITKLLERYEPLLPPWCSIAHVKFDRNLDSAQCGVDFEYRRVRLTFGPNFFNKTEVEKVEIFIHEMIHAYAHHLHCIAYDTLGDAFAENPLALTGARKALREANEGVATDLAGLVLRLMGDSLDGE